jgi:hypothetical protein
MGRPFRVLNMDLIQEGQFKADADEELAEIQKLLLGHIKKYGNEATEKAKAELTIKIVLQRSSTDEQAFSVKTSFTKKTPGRPSHVTLAIQDEDDDGQPRLFVRRSGSDEATPRQGKLTTDRGEAINPDTGEVIPAKKEKK